MKKILCVLLIATLVSTFLFGCGKKGNDKDEHRDSDTTVAEDSLHDDLPKDLNFGDTSVRFVISEAQNGNFSERSLGVVDYTKNAVDTAVYNRNLRIKDRLGISIETVAITGYKNFTEIVEPALASGDDAYDILAGYQYFDIPLALKGYLKDANDLDRDNAGYINIEKEYWPSDYIRSMNYKDRIYWLTGDLSLRYTSGVYCTFVNKAVYDAVLTESYGSIFDVVRRGEWDLDMLERMSAAAYVDKNNDSVCDENDRIGIILEKGSSFVKTALAVGAGVEWSSTDAEGNISLEFNAGNNHLVDVIQKMDALYNSGLYAYRPANSDDETAMTLFAQGRSLFVMSKLYNAENYLDSMEDDYYIIPMPKFDTKQDGYRSVVHDGVNIFGICYCSSRVRESAALLELMAAESYRSVRPVYYDEALKFRYTNDPDSSRMIDVISKGTYTDFALAWDRSITSNWIRGAISDSPVSALKRFGSRWNKKLADILNVLEGLPA